MKLTVALLILGTAAVSAESSKLDLISQIKERLASGGANNCQYKCANLFNINNIWDKEGGNAALNGLQPGSPSSVLNEFLGCFSGCSICNGGQTENCMGQCKNQQWFNVNWWYNPYSGGTDFFTCDNEQLAAQKACVNNCGVPPTGGRAQLPKSYTDCTQKCYDSPTFGIVAINQQCNAGCQAQATCSKFTADDKDCSTDDVKSQYTAEMCGSGVLKNIIEPDKACQFGCVQNLCQDGAGCTGVGVWSNQTDYENCQIITPQQKGSVYTIVPEIFENPQSDLAGCCTQSKVCCEYKAAWASAQPRQRRSVCNVANKKSNCGANVPGFDISNFENDISKGAYPGNGCEALWKTNGGICINAGFSCNGCTQSTN